MGSRRRRCCAKRKVSRGVRNETRGCFGREATVGSEVEGDQKFNSQLVALFESLYLASPFDMSGVRISISSGIVPQRDHDSYLVNDAA